MSLNFKQLGKAIKTINHGRFWARLIIKLTGSFYYQDFKINIQQVAL